MNPGNVWCEKIMIAVPAWLFADYISSMASWRVGGMGKRVNEVYVNNEGEEMNTSGCCSASANGGCNARWRDHPKIIPSSITPAEAVELVLQYAVKLEHVGGVREEGLLDFSIFFHSSISARPFLPFLYCFFPRSPPGRLFILPVLLRKQNPPPPSSCLSDKEEDEIYGFGYGVFSRQMLQHRQQKLALATQNTTTAMTPGGPQATYQSVQTQLGFPDHSYNTPRAPYAAAVAQSVYYP
ncbi:hypothetical protein ALC57_02291 [Trachymyrmex cornetzi]|uniref:Uncharacterized protein n=1 Tax=Trachymyrmex cornetzi TaxID=471704 RepID=A0A195EJ93_9HYME|nr:hypothetical protein ALC57_02291 [Trachymyrmex cornetzi]